jgi:hypothetical protein
MKIRPVRAELFDPDGKTDDRPSDSMMKLRVAFRNFANAPKTSTVLVHVVVLNIIL